MVVHLLLITCEKGIKMNYQNRGHYVSTEQGFMPKVYAWMCAGLVVSASVSYYVLSTPEVLYKVMSSFGLMIGLMALMFGLIFYINARFVTMSTGLLVLSYLLFTAIQGVFLAPLLFQYTGESIINVFATAALMFLGMAVYGSVTKADLSSMGNILLMGLWGLIVSGIVNIFLRSSALSMVTSALGVGVFSMFVAYDVQMLRSLSRQLIMQSNDVNKFAIVGALNLYLNALNLFLYLLRLFGKEKRR